jgi:hypothetical protein
MGEFSASVSTQGRRASSAKADSLATFSIRFCSSESPGGGATIAC